jgi:hypothetical protein
MAAGMLATILIMNFELGPHLERQLVCLFDHIGPIDLPVHRSKGCVDQAHAF